MKRQGNKSKYLKYIIPNIPSTYNTYIEPFVGSGAVFLKLEPSKWIINDLSTDIFNFWMLVKQNPELLIQNLKMFSVKFKKLSKQKKILFCRELVSSFNNIKTQTKKIIIEKFIMTFCSFNGSLFRNQKYYFTGLDFNSLKNIFPFLKSTYFEHINNISKYLNNSNGKIYNNDYKVILNKSKKGDFLFLDPPYIDDNYQFQYNKDEKVDNSFIQELYHQIKLLDKKGVKWLMTQADTPIIRKLFKNYTITKYPVYRMNLKSYKYELIIKNY